jgi:hypothetical protein
MYSVDILTAKMFPHTDQVWVLKDAFHSSDATFFSLKSDLEFFFDKL